MTRQLADSAVSKMETALTLLEQNVRQEGNSATAGKLRQLKEKAVSGQVVLAFCGHFSAGKSTLINRLCGHPLLPSSPIPTSANLVSIGNGGPGAQVTRKIGVLEQSSIVEAIPLEELDAYCINGTDIESVRITYPITFLGERALLLDTPGIDSTDDAHHMATESALHLADVVFYVMDYNHVQSEVNFAFAKKMKDWGKPLYLIINQIDKHKEYELSFEEYREGAVQAFRNWNIEPDGMLYVTMKEPAHPHNEWEKLRWLVTELIRRGEPLSRYSIDKSVHFLTKEHGKWLSEQNEPEKERLREQLEGQEGAEQAQELLAEKQRELSAVRAMPEELITGLRKEIMSIIENANITPAATRDLAHDYLQSRKPGFKVGFFAGAAKTAAEIARRLEAFRADFAEQVRAQLDWHLRDALKKAAGRYGVKTEAVLAGIEALGVDVTPGWLAEQVNPAAEFGGEYTLNFSKQIAADIRSMYRKQAFAAIDSLAVEARMKAEHAAEELERELAALQAQLGALLELQRIERSEAESLQALRRQWPVEQAERPSLPDLRQFVPVQRHHAAEQAAQLHTTPLDAILQAAVYSGVDAAEGKSADAAVSHWSGGDYRKRLSDSAAQLETAAELIQDIAAMKSISASMREKAQRLRSNTFTIALFGAFSAGKSSFANALIGERILPVSPNPTTAAINKIMPPQPDGPHGTAKVRMKSADGILQDVQYSLGVLGEEAADMESALRKIAGLSPAQVSAKGKPHYSFLKAVEKGWSEASQTLGSDVRISSEQFSAYVAEESKSCFVEYIELFYSNPLTDQGIVFVDTPGADSINARHTGVAFDYIKNADAILFVTYYNHAFSQADREFLLQLGRVKDSFELDKMFFIVNAADLASSEEELEGVVKHVEANLMRHGIRSPRIYPVSSQLAAEGKLSGNEALLRQSGILPFEQDFVRFTLEELSGIAVHSAKQELQRAANVLEQWIEGAQEGEERRKERVAALQGALTEALALLRSTNDDEERRELSKEIRELLYYVKQRTMYRFGEFYNLAFNPTAFREDTNDAKAALQSAWRDLLRMISFDLSQEVLATTLRVENAMNGLAGKRYNQWAAQLRGMIETYEPEPYEGKTFVTPTVSEQLEAPDVSEKLLMSFFKNAKHFFEGEGKSKLRVELESRLTAPVTQFLERQTETLEQAYTDQLSAWFAELRSKQEASVREHVEGLLDALEMRVDLEALMRKQERIQALIEK